MKESSEAKAYPLGCGIAQSRPISLTALATVSNSHTENAASTGVREAEIAVPLPWPAWMAGRPGGAVALVTLAGKLRRSQRRTVLGGGGRYSTDQRCYQWSRGRCACGTNAWLVDRIREGGPFEGLGWRLYELATQVALDLSSTGCR